MAAYRALGVSFVLLAASAFGQTNPAAKTPAGTDSRAQAYFHYSLGHLYSELAGAYGNRGDFFNTAVENYKAALKADPTASFIAEELSDLYIQSGRLRDAVSEAEEALKQNPDDLNYRRILGRIYFRMIGDPQQKRIDENMVAKAIEQYQKITEKDPKDVDSWLMLGRLHQVSNNSTDAMKDYKKVLDLSPDNQDAMTGLAMVYTNLGDMRAAADLLKKASEKEPNPHSLAALADTYEQMKEYPLAVQALRRAVDQQPGNTDLKKALAQDLLLAEQPDEAAKVYAELVGDDPKDEESYLRLSQIYRQKHDIAKAREYGQKAKDIDPANLEIQYNDVALLEAEGKLPDAIKVLKGMLDSAAKKSYTQPERTTRIRLLERLGFLYRENEQYDPGVEAFRQIGELDSAAAPGAAAQIIDTYRMAKNFNKAEAEADAASKKWPDDRVIRSVHASLLADLGKNEQAVAELKKLLNGKEDRDVYLQLAQIHEKGKNFVEEGKDLDQAEKLSQSSDEKEGVLFQRGAMYERQKNISAAEAQFRKVLDLNPKNAGALNYLGYMLADNNTRLPEAQELIQRALTQEPNNGAYLDSLGWVYFKMNRYPEAEEQLRKALGSESMAKDPTVHDHLGDVYFQQGKIRDAIAQWQNSLAAYRNASPSEQDPADLTKVQKKLDDAKVRLARENGGKP